MTRPPEPTDDPRAERPAPNEPASPGLREAVVRLPGPSEESLAFWQLRARIARTEIRQALTHSRLRLSLIGVLSLMLWLSMLWLFADGFRFLQTTIPDRSDYDTAIRGVYSIFFAALMVMLAFSSAILMYGLLFRGRDLTLLMSLPTRVERVFAQKFQETIFFSGWAFLLMGSPMLLAYGLIERAPWYYYVVLLPFLVAFAYIPTAVGAIICLVVVRFLPRRRHLVLTAAVLVILGIAIWIVWSLLTGPQGALLTPQWFRQTISRFRFSEQQLLPSWWLGTGLLEAAHHGWDQCVLLLGVLVANALLLSQLAVCAARRWYRAAHGQLRTMATARKNMRPNWFDRTIAQRMPFPLTVRLMLLKDIRIFRRDPGQWSQFLLFFALLGFYFLNIRQFGVQSRTAAWDNMMSFVNLTVMGLILTTLTTRHVFPMISLEGQRLWLLGVIGLRRNTILWSKLVFAVGGTLIPCALLVLVSDLMLEIPLLLQISHQVICLVFCLGLSGIAVGLGAKMPDMREKSPPRIAAGFGGTLNLVASSLFVVLVVALAAMPWHLYVLSGNPMAAQWLSARPTVLWWLHVWLWAGTITGLALGAAATIVLPRIGLQAFRTLET